MHWGISSKDRCNADVVYILFSSCCNAQFITACRAKSPSLIAWEDRFFFCVQRDRKHQDFSFFVPGISAAGMQGPRGKDLNVPQDLSKSYVSSTEGPKQGLLRLPITGSNILFCNFCNAHCFWAELWNEGVFDVTHGLQSEKKEFSEIALFHSDESSKMATSFQPMCMFFQFGFKPSVETATLSPFQGFFMIVVGPTLPDLQTHTNSTTDQMSYVMTARSFMNFVGAITGKIAGDTAFIFVIGLDTRFSLGVKSPDCASDLLFRLFFSSCRRNLAGKTEPMVFDECVFVLGLPVCDFCASVSSAHLGWAVPCSPCNIRRYCYSWYVQRFWILTFCTETPFGLVKLRELLSKWKKAERRYKPGRPCGVMYTFHRCRCCGGPCPRTTPHLSGHWPQNTGPPPSGGITWLCLFFLGRAWQ